jgi:cell division GTPase FtsZ
MSVTSETIKENKEVIEDDVSNEIDNKLEELKAKMASMKKKSDVISSDATVQETRKPKRSLNFGVIGTGQAGSRVAEAFYDLGYNAVVFNTASQDLEQIKVPDTNKYLLEYGIGGAAKDLDIGFNAADLHREGIENIIARELGEAEVFLLCLSLGGGSGAGSHDVMLDVLSSIGKQVVVITILPMSSEDAQTKSNALKTLAKLAQSVNDKVVSNLIVVDNAKLEAIYSDVSHMDFFSVGNKAIVTTIDAFNTYSMKSSNDKGMDSMEFAKLFTDGEGLCIYGEVTVPNYAEDTTMIAEAVIENHENGLLASGFDLAQTKYVGLVIAANEAAWKQIPRGSVEYARELIKENCPGSDSIFYGTYVDDSIKEDVVKLYTMFSGLGLPDSRVVQLRKDVEAETVKTQERVKARGSSLTLDTGKDKTISKAEEIRQKITKNKSKFSQSFGKGKLDFRK